MENEKLIGRGRTADVFAWGEGRILKLYQSWMPANVVEQEFNITRAAKAVGIPVPETFEIVEMAERHGIVFERIAGLSLLNELQSKPWQLFSAARQLAELHAQIHGMSMPVGFPGQRNQISQGIEATQKIGEADKQFLQTYLAKLPEGDSLCHGDFHPDNILISEQGPIVIDWMTGTRGNPLADVARTCLLFQIGDLPPGIPEHMRLLINLFRKLLNTLYLNRYLQLRPAKRQQIDQWDLPLLAARLRESENIPQEKSRVLARLNALLKDQAR